MGFTANMESASTKRRRLKRSRLDCIESLLAENRKSRESKARRCSSVQESCSFPLFRDGWARGSPKSSKQYMLVGTTPGTTRSEFAVNHNGGYAPNAVVFCLASCLGLLRVVDHNFVRRASKPLNQFNGFLAG